MARSRRNELLDQLLALLKMMPWWVGPMMSVVAFAGIRFLLPMALPHGNNDGSQILFNSFYDMLSWFAPGVILQVWLVAEGFKLSNRRLFNRQKDMADIRNLSWQDFEHFITEAYRRRGYVAQHVGLTSGDGGIDIILVGNGERILVQCKQWRAFKVGAGPVRELMGIVVSEKADRGILITSGQFTSEARRFGERNAILELVDGVALGRMIAEMREGEIQPTNTTAAAAASKTPPRCPLCGGPMGLRTARRGKFAGRSFWGCEGYPRCEGGN